MSSSAPESFWKKVAPGVTIAVIAAAIIGAGRYWWEPICAGVAGGWDWLTTPTEVSRLWLGVLYACLVVVLAGGVALLLLALRGDPIPEHHVYTEDEFFGILWRWDWNARWGVEPIPHCHGCRRQVHSEVEKKFAGHADTHFQCQACYHPITLPGSFDDIQTRVRVEIRHKVETGEWKERVAHKDQRTA